MGRMNGGCPREKEVGGSCEVEQVKGTKGLAGALAKDRERGE